MFTVTLRPSGGVRRLSRVDRRALALIAAAGLALTAAPSALGAGAEDLLAQSNTGTLTADGIAAGGDTGSLSSQAKPATKSHSSSGSTAASSGSSADQLPFTGSDPRITLLLGLAAVLAGAGLRLRTRDPLSY